jgi:hypothetical protein
MANISSDASTDVPNIPALYSVSQSDEVQQPM